MPGGSLADNIGGDTFLIDPQGKVAKHYPDVDPVQNVGQVLQDLERLGAPTG
jgi:peroxiredoxin